MKKQIAEVFHPGEHLKEELEERGWKQRDLADRTGLSVRTIGAIVRGQKSINPAIAEGLGSVFGKSARLWLNLQKAYDEARREKGKR